MILIHVYRVMLENLSSWIVSKKIGGEETTQSELMKKRRRRSRIKQMNAYNEQKR